MIDSQLIDTAHEWLCKQRRHFPANADIWYLRYHWPTERARILSALVTRTYYFSPMQRIAIADGSIVHLWSAADSLVLKALTFALTPVLPVSRRCTHSRGHGGLKATVRETHQQQPAYRFVMRTDVKSFYESIDHHLLIARLAVYIKDRFILNLLCQSISRSV